jgi:hypothetical protein
MQVILVGDLLANDVEGARRLTFALINADEEGSIYFRLGEILESFETFRSVVPGASPVRVVNEAPCPIAVHGRLDNLGDVQMHV